MMPIVAEKSSGFAIFGTCGSTKAKTTSGYQRTLYSTCSLSGSTLRAVGKNEKYHLGDTTNTERNSFVNVDLSTLTAAFDSNITEIYGSFYSVFIKTSTNKLYA
jgi:hypothetical protein